MNLKSKTALAALALIASSAAFAQLDFNDTSINLGTIAQGAKIQFQIIVSNPDSLPAKIELKHIR